MRYSSLTLAVLATSVAAIPHRRHPHPHPVRRDADVVTTSIVETVEAVLYVDQNGNPFATTAESVDAAPTDPTDPAIAPADYGPPWSQSSGSGGYGGPQPMPTHTPQDSSSEASYSQPPQTTPAPPASSDTTPATSSAPPPQSASPDDGDDGETVGYSIAYSPYMPDHSCKTQAQVDADIDDLQQKYGMVRIYGTDCDQVRIVMNAAKRNNMKVFAGIWDIDNAASEASILAEVAKDDWSRIYAVSVGNELLSSRAPSDLVNAIKNARSVLQQADYTGPVTTVDVWITLIQFLPDTSNGLCDNIDFIAANCHAFFDGNVTAEGAGQWVADQAGTLKKYCPNKDVVVTESGWPSEGPTNGLAVPGLQNQRTVINGLRAAYTDEKEKMVLFSAYNDPWKQDNGFGVEPYWGIYGNAPTAR